MTCLRSFPVPPSSCRDTLKLALHAPETLTMAAALQLAEIEFSRSRQKNDDLDMSDTLALKCTVCLKHTQSVSCFSRIWSLVSVDTLTCMHMQPVSNHGMHQ